jgi:hypothetical protein
LQPAQVYETTIFDRESGAGLTFVTVPLHALQYPDPSEALEAIGAALGFEPAELIPGEEEVAEKRLADALDEMLAYPTEQRGPWTVLKRRLGRPEFATYLASEATIPVEQSAVGGKTLTEILSSGGVAYGIAQGKPLTILMGLGTIILVGPAQVIGEWGTAKLRELLNIPGPD